MKSFIFGATSTTRRAHGRRTLFGRQPGQAIVLVAVLMIVLLGFTGLALDGGELYFLQRDAQNAADASLLAALYEWCGNNALTTPEALRHELAVAAGLATAKSNGFENGVNNTTVTVTRPSPAPGTTTPLRTNLITVTIVANKTARLIQVVYNGPLQVTAKAIGECTPAFRITSGGAMMGLGNGCGPGIQFTGSGATISGGVWSNGDVDLNGNASAGGGTTITGGAGGAGTVGGSNATYTPPGVGGQDPITVPPLWDITEFAPGGDIAVFAGSDYYSVVGDVDDWNDFFNPDLDFDNPAPYDELPDGIYYASGSITLGTSDFNNFELDAMAGVTLVSPGVINVQVPGGAPCTEDCFTHVPYQVDTDLATAAGIATVMPLMFSTAGNTNPAVNPDPCGNGNEGIIIGGKYIWEGAIYAPNGQIAISTSSAGSANGALIGYTVTVSGSDLDIAFNPDSIPPVPPEVGLIQ